MTSPQLSSKSECLDRIDARDSAVRGWCFIDREAQAGHGPLAGVVVGVKDVIDVAGMPTTYGSQIFADRFAATDAEAVARLRAAGAVVLGKTVTAEFATYHPGPTENPRKPGHTPGGSSSGSAAVVADGQAHIALGTQTAGSMIRPGSFCGTLAFKPSFGRYPLAGVLETASSLDTLGIFAANLPLLALADSVLAQDGEVTEPLDRLRVGICRTPAWHKAEAAMQVVLIEFGQSLVAAGHHIEPVTLPEPFVRLAEAQAVIHRREAAEALGAIRRDHPQQISREFREMIDAGVAETEESYLAACALQQRCRSLLAEVFAGYDLLLTPGAPGAAPKGLGATGDPVFQRIWTAVGAPCLGFTGAWQSDGLPLGLQAIALPGTDRQLLANAAALLIVAPLPKPVTAREETPK